MQRCSAEVQCGGAVQRCSAEVLIYLQRLKADVSVTQPVNRAHTKRVGCGESVDVCVNDEMERARVAQL